MTKIVNSWNEWDPLKHIIVGRADNCCIPPIEPAMAPKIPKDSDMKGKYGPRPQDTIDRANDLLDNFSNILEKRGIKVDRPTPIDFNQKIATPDWSIDSMFGCMPPRDIILTLGNEMLEATMSFRSRWFEFLCYRPLLQSFFDQDPQMKWESAPKPRLTEKSYRDNYLTDEITIEQRYQWVKNKKFVTTEEEPLFDAADVLRMGKDLFIQHGFTTNLKGIDWIQRHFPNHRVHTLNFPTDPFPTHIDATFTPLRPGLILNNPERRLPEEQRKVFHKNEWEIIEAARPAHNSPPPLCYSSVWLSMNILMLDTKTVCVEDTEIHQMEQLDRLNFEVIPVPFRDAYPFGGALHCATTDVYREGECENYFPNQ